MADATGELSPKAPIIERPRIDRVLEKKEITEAVVRENCRTAVEEGWREIIDVFEKMGGYLPFLQETGRAFSGSPCSRKNYNQILLA